MAYDETYAFSGDTQYSAPRPTYHKETPGALPVKTSGGWHWRKSYYCVRHLKQEYLTRNSINIVLGKYGEYRLSEDDFMIIKLMGVFS